MKFNMFGQQEEEQYPFAPQDPIMAPSPMALPTDQPSAPAPLNPVVKDYLMSKRAPQAEHPPMPEMAPELPIEQPKESGSGFDWQVGIAGLGESIAGRSPMAAIKAIRDNRIVQEERAGDSDPTSEQSLMAQRLASKLMPGQDFSKASAAQLKKVMPGLEKLADIEARKLDRQSEMDFRNRTLGLQQQAADRESSKIDNKLTEAQKTADKEFAKDYNEWNSRGKSSFQKNIELLESAKSRLSDGSAGSGRVSGRLPDVLRPEASIQAEQDARQAAQGALRATLGPQFTENEGKRIMEAAYDPKLSEAANIEKITRAIDELKRSAEAMDSRSKVYESEGTLKNYKTQSSANASNSSSFPKTIRKGNQTATVSNEQELKEAMSEGFQ